MIHEDIYQTPSATHSFINFFLNDLEFIEKKAPKLIKVPVIRPSGWLPPPEGLTKINADAAVGRAGDHGAVAVVCRDQDGAFLGASTIKLWFISDPTTLEAHNLAKHVLTLDFGRHVWLGQLGELLFLPVNI